MVLDAKVVVIGARGTKRRKQEYKMTEKQFRMMQYKELARQQKQLEKERKEMTKKHEEYLTRDTQEIMSVLVLHFFKKGYTVAKVQKLIQDICKEWYEMHELCQKRGITVCDYCAEQTNIDIREMVE